MINVDDFNKICQEYGMVRSEASNNAYTFSQYRKNIWAIYIAHKKVVNCWNRNWELYKTLDGIRPASVSNLKYTKNVDDLRKELVSMTENFKRMYKQLRLKKVVEL